MNSELLQEWGWKKMAKGEIYRTFEFETFMKAIDFVNRVATIAESMNHHPEIHISYTSVKIKSWTHDASAFTNKDFDLAAIVTKNYFKYK
jgi:4a-hydroxytetrahydrobiopterin dehydratase